MAVAFRSATDGFGTGADFTATEPAGAAQDDVLVAICVATAAATITKPTGWTTLYSGNAGAFDYEVCWVARGASAPSYTFGISTSAFRQVTVAAFSGADTTSPFSASTNGGYTPTTNPDPPSASPGTSDGMAAALVAHWSSATFVAPSGYTLRGNTSTSDIGYATKPLTSTAAENPAAFTGPTDANDTYAATLLLQPAVVSTPQQLRPDADLDTAGWTTAPLHSKVSDQSDATVITATAAGGSPAGEQTTTLLADALLASGGFASITLAAIDDDPDASDGSWAVASSNNVQTTARVGFPTPPGNPSGVQTFKVLVRQTTGSGTGTPKARNALYEAGTLRATGAENDIGVLLETVVTQTFDLAAITLADPTGAGVEALFVGTQSGGNAATRSALDLGAINWDIARYATAATPGSTGTARLSLAGGGEPTSRTLHSLKVRARKTSAAHTGTLRLRLYEGATARSAEYETAALTTALADYALALTNVEAAAITSYADLELRARGYASAGHATVFEVAETWLETPASSGPDTTPPTTTLGDQTRTTISRVPGWDAFDVTITTDEPFVEYELRRVPAATSTRTEGAQIETAVVASTTSLVVTVTDDELVAALAAEGENTVKAFTRDAAGNWSP